MQVGEAKIAILDQYLASSRVVNDAPDRGKLVTLIAGSNQIKSNQIYFRRQGP